MCETMEWWQWIIKIVLGIILILVMIGSALFGYICTKARARSWGVGCFTITALTILALYWIIFRLF